MEIKFYLCPVCGNLICKVVDSGVTPVCCGAEMKLLEPKMADLGREKHVPVVECAGKNAIRVKVGEVPHPCTPEHHISMIAVQLRDGVIIKPLDPSSGCAPEAEFSVSKDDVVAVYEFCNLHGLWGKEMSK